MKTVNMEEARKPSALAISVEERHYGYSESFLRMREVYWVSKHHDVRSWISTCTGDFAKHGRKKRNCGVDHGVELGRYPLHMLAVYL